MGKDKARVHLGNATMLHLVRKAVGTIGLPVRVVRKDLVDRCGPVGGIYTGLATTAWDAELFMACDMPFVTGWLVRQFLAEYRRSRRPIFAWGGDLASFPCLLPRSCLGQIETQMQKQDYSLQGLFTTLRAKRIELTGTSADRELFNVNTPGDLTEALRRLQGQQ